MLEGSYQVELVLEHRVLRMDGSLGWTFSRASILDPQGEIAEWLGVASDITARKDAENALRDADQRKDEFLATLSHELRNPLAPLRNGLQLMRLQGDRPNPAVHEIMERQLNHLVRLPLAAQSGIGARRSFGHVDGPTRCSAFMIWTRVASSSKCSFCALRKPPILRRR